MKGQVMLEYTTTDDMARHYARAHQLRAESSRAMLQILWSFVRGRFLMRKGPRIPAQPQHC